MRSVIQATLLGAIRAAQARARSPLARRFVSGASWLVAGTVLARAGPLLAGVATGRVLGSVGMGGFSLVVGTAAVFATLVGSGLGTAATRFVAEERERSPARAGRVVGFLCAASSAIAAAVALGVFLSAELIAERFFHQPALTPLVEASAPLVLFTIVGVVAAACLSGLEFFRPVALANALGAALLLACVVPAARVFGLGGVVAALGAQAVCIAVVVGVALRRACRALGIPIALRVPAAELRPMARFILPAMLSIVVYTPVTWYGTLILARTPDGVAQLGVFGAAQHWFAAIAFIPTALSPVVLSLLASDARGGRARQTSVLKGSLLVNGAIATVIGAAAALLARPLLALYGPEFVAAVPALRVLALSAVIGSLLVAVGQLIVARGSMWWGFALNLLWGVTFVTVALRAVPALGATGLAIAYLSSYSVHLLSCALYVTLGHRRGPTAAPDAIPVAPRTLP